MLKCIPKVPKLIKLISERLLYSHVPQRYRQNRSKVYSLRAVNERESSKEFARMAISMGNGKKQGTGERKRENRREMPACIIIVYTEI